jgi:hypothetical protein
MFKHLTDRTADTEKPIRQIFTGVIKKYEKRHKSRYSRLLVLLFRLGYFVFSSALVVALSALFVFIYLSLIVVIPVIYLLFCIAITSALVKQVGQGWETWMMHHWNRSLLYSMYPSIDINVLSFVYITIPMIITGGALISFFTVVAMFYRNNVYGQ